MKKKNGYKTKNKHTKMGLDSLVNEQGYVHSEKELENITFTKDSWAVALRYYSDAIYVLLSRENLDNEEIKTFIELIDELLENKIEIEGGELTENEINDLERTREDLIDMLKFNQ